MLILFLAFASVWTTRYGMSVGIGGLHYIFMGAGFTVRSIPSPSNASILTHPQLGAQVGSRLLDRIYRRLKKRNNGIATPEMRLPLLAIGSFLLPAGLLLYGWTAQVSQLVPIRTVRS